MARLKDIKIENGFRTGSVLLRQPMAEKLLKKERPVVFDFGCGDCCFTMGMVKALAQKGNAKEILVTAVNADYDNGGSRPLIYQDGKAQVTFNLLEPVELNDALQTAYFRKVMQIPDADLAMIFNPAPPDEICQLILYAHSKMTGIPIDIPLLAAGEEISLDRIRDNLVSVLMTMRFTPPSLHSMDLNEIINITKLIFFQRATTEVVPAMLGRGGILFIASDNLIPTNVKLQILESSGYEIKFQGENCPEGIFDPTPITQYNRYLIGAELKR